MTPKFGVAPSGYRLPDSAHIGRVRLQVADLRRSIAFYERTLGLRVIREAKGSAELGPHGDDSVLLELRERPDARPVPRRGLLGLYHFAVLLPDRASLGRFIAHLAELGEYAGMSDHLVSEAVYLTDPDGLGIEVYSDRPREGWLAIDGQIAMTTKPLDVRSVVDAAEGRKWNGAPEGTRIGHVHFHVADIGEAERFYHASLGLDKIVWSYPGALFMSAGGYHHHVGVNTWAAGASPAADDDAKLLEWELVLPDASSVDDAVRSLESSGFQVGRVDGGAITRDQWGIGLRLRQEA
jgi:catechol 2,3-dioxygenase